MPKKPFQRKNLRAAICLAMAAAVSGCGGVIPLDPNALRYSHDGVVTRLMVTGTTPQGSEAPYCGIDPTVPGQTRETLTHAQGAPVAAYQVGPGDDLKFNIFGEPGMTELIARVDAEGFVQLPVIDAVRVSGMTTREIQAHLKQAYADQFIGPWVTVELFNAESHPVYFLGEFRKPGVKHLEFATDLIESLALAEGLGPDAYLPGARLIREKSVCTVDLQALLKHGDFSQNVWIQSGDILFAPSREDMRVYILGGVPSPGGYAFGPEGRTILEALAMAKGPRIGSAKLREVRVIRTLSPTRGELILLDVRAMLAGQALDFPLEPGDVIYVPTSEIGSWNEALGLILPSLSVIGGILTPITLVQTLLDDGS